MLLTYLLIVCLLFIIIRSVAQLTQLIIYGGVRRKNELSKAFQRIEGKKKSAYKEQTKTPVSNKISKYLQTILVCAGIFLLALFLFRSIFPAILLSALGLLYPRVKAARVEKQLKEIMLLQFREAILSMSSSLKAGSSLQIALQRCETDLERELQLKKERPMLDALKKMNGDIQLGKPIEEVLLDFKYENELEDISQFIDAIIMTRSKGGNLADVIANTSKSISDKILIQQEIKLATAQKRMEAGVLTFLPVGLVVVLMVLNPGYMQPMYETTLGTILLFAAIIMLIANYFIGRKVTHIDI
jgi:tight adherence protein B